MHHHRAVTGWRGALAIIAVALASPSWVAAQTRTSAFDYDATTGLLTKEIVEPGDSGLCVVTEYGYDAFGNKTSVTTRNCNGAAGSSPGVNSESAAPAPGSDAAFTARTSSTGFDTQGRFPTSSANALGHTEDRAYDARFGSLTRLTGPNGLVTEWKYDGFGRKLLEKRADGTGTRWEYLYCLGVNGGTTPCPTIGGAAGAYLIRTTPVAAPIDLVAGTAGPAIGAASTVYYDSLEREIRSEVQGFDGTPILKDTERDARGRVSRVSKPYYAGQTAYWTTYQYDDLDRVISEVAPDGTSATTFGYAALTTTVTDARGQTTTRIKNSQGQLTRVIDAAGGTTSYAYDAFGNLEKTTDVQGVVTTLGYDRRGRKTSMLDPDMGLWRYDYNALGELVRQTDAKAQVTTFGYDVLGRMTARSDPSLNSSWTYDTQPNGKGKLARATAGNGYERVPTYDTLGRVATVAYKIDQATPYTVTTAYDTLGRADLTTYPTGFAVRTRFNALGYADQLTNAATGAVLWTLNKRDAEGRLSQQTYGNGIITDETYDTVARVLTIKAGGGTLQNQQFTYDAVGNLQSRVDYTQGPQGLTETYYYDALNRLTQAYSTVYGVKMYGYDANGNLLYKSDAGTYTYDTLHPHQVKSITGTVNTTFSYDLNGNLIAGNSRTLTWTAFDKPDTITKGTSSAAFSYDSERERIRQVATDGTTIYVGAGQGGMLFERKTLANGTIESHHYVYAGGRAIADHTQRVVGMATTNSTQWFHVDHLGSVVAVTNQSGVICERLSFDAWGKRRQPSGVDDTAGTLKDACGESRGFTGHEQLDRVGLVHMNGRVFDPLVARFASADPILQYPYDGQSYNRYSYLLNNPLSGMDPTGYKAFWKKKWFRTAVAVGIAVFAPELLASNPSWGLAGITSDGVASLTITGGAVVGGTAGLVASGGDFRAGLTGALSGGLFAWAGGIGETSWDFNRYAAHAAAGCVSGAAGGGNCGRGALSAVAGKGATNFSSGNPVAAVVAGGTVSVIGGGKFANGAETAAFGYLFNKCGHDGCGLFGSARTASPPSFLALDLKAMGLSAYRLFQAVGDYAYDIYDTLIFNKPPVEPPKIPDDWDGTTPPDSGWRWSGRGQPAPSGAHGGWVSPDGSQSLHPDFDHGPPIGPHVDWNVRGSKGGGWRIFPDGRVEPKG